MTLIIYLGIYGINVLLFPIKSSRYFIYIIPLKRIAHTTAIVTLDLEHWLEPEIAHGSTMKDWFDNPLYHHSLLLSYISLLIYVLFGSNIPSILIIFIFNLFKYLLLLLLYFVHYFIFCWVLDYFKCVCVCVCVCVYIYIITYITNGRTTAINCTTKGSVLSRLHCSKARCFQVRVQCAGVIKIWT